MERIRHICALNVGQINTLSYKLISGRRGKMDWVDRMNSPLDYIENNLEEDINYKKTRIFLEDKTR